MEYRKTSAGSVAVDGMRISGLGVPYDVPTTYAGRREKFAPGSVDPTSAILCAEHGEPIGTLKAAETERGIEIEAVISDTARGRDIATLIADGVVRGLSIGFEPEEWHVDTDDEGEILVWDSVIAREFSVVAFPAYPTAGIGRNRRMMDNGTTGSDAAVLAAAGVTRAEFDVLADKVRALHVEPQTADAGSQWRSYGQFVKAVAAGDAEALDQYRAYTGGTSNDGVRTPPAVLEYVRLANARRRVIPEITQRTLPATGMSVDYVTVQTDTISVGKQAPEGSDLAGGKIALKTASSQVSTYGGYTQLSMQLIERSSVSVLDIALLAMGLRYSKAVDGVVAAELRRLETANAAAGVVISDTATASDWLNGLVDLAVKFEEADLTLGCLVVGKEIFKKLLGLKDGDRRVMSLTGDSPERIGTARPTMLTGAIDGLKVVYHPGVARAVAIDPVAVEWHESPNAPARLSDTAVVQLAQTYSVYGYGAVVLPFQAGVLPIKAA